MNILCRSFMQRYQPWWLSLLYQSVFWNHSWWFVLVSEVSHWLLWFENFVCHLFFSLITLKILKVIIFFSFSFIDSIIIENPFFHFYFVIFCMHDALYRVKDYGIYSTWVKASSASGWECFLYIFFNFMQLEYIQ